MRVGVFIPLSRKLEDYYWAVRECFEQWDEIYTVHGEIFTPTNNNETIVRNAALEYFKDFDYVFCVDADEFILPEEQRLLVERMEKNKYDCGMCRVLHYTKDLEHIYQIQEHKPIVIVDPKKVSFYEGRCARGFDNPVFCDDIVIHHLGYTFSDEKMKWKQENYWDVKRPNGIKDIMSFPTVGKYLPWEIKKLI